MAKEVNRIKPDNVTYNEDGEKQAELFTKKQADALKKAKEKLAKCDKAIDKCMNNADYDALQKWQKGEGDGGSDDE